VGGPLGVLTGGAALVVDAETKAAAALVPAGPEPVLGGE
jgi:hypothetical protein